MSEQEKSIQRDITLHLSVYARNKYWTLTIVCSRQEIFFLKKKKKKTSARLNSCKKHGLVLEM